MQDSPPSGEGVQVDSQEGCTESLESLKGGLEENQPSSLEKEALSNCPEATLLILSLTEGDQILGKIIWRACRLKVLFFKNENSLDLLGV